MNRFDYTQSSVTFIRAIDLIKVANQLLEDKMEYARVSITSSPNEDLNGSIQIHAIPSIDSDDVKEYPLIKSNSMVEFEV